MEASVLPVITASHSPSSKKRAPVAKLPIPVEQAEETEMAGPLNPKRLANNCPPAWGKNSLRKSQSTEGSRTVSNKLSTPPLLEEKVVPIRPGETLNKPAIFQASSAAATANWRERSCLRRACGIQTSRAWAARGWSKASHSFPFSNPILETPDISLSQVWLELGPRGVTIPYPVTTMDSFIYGLVIQNSKWKFAFLK